jgi:MFS family permease
LFSVWYAFVAYAFVFQEVPPLIDALMMQFSIASAAEAGLLMTIVVIPGIFLALPAGLIADKYSIRLVGVVSIVLVALGSIMSVTAGSFVALLLGRLILGIGAGFIVTSLPVLVQQWFSHEELGKAMGFYSINMPVATIMAFATASLLLVSSGDWRPPLLVGTMLAGTATVIFILFVREGPFRKSRNDTKVPWRSAFSNHELWKTGLVLLLFQVTTLSFLSWAPKLSHDYRGLDLVYASTLASSLMLAAIPFAPLFGWASDKIRRRRPFLIAGPLLMALAMFSSAYATGVSLVASVVFLGIAAAMVPPIVALMPTELLEPDVVGLGFGILALCLSIGAALAAPLFGAFLDTTGSMEFSFLGVAVFSIFGSLVALTIKTK